MTQYIDKDALVAEIERRIKGLEDSHADTVEGYAGEISGLKRLLSFIDTLEVKEMDVEKEMQAFALLYLEPLKNSDSNIGINITMAQLYRCAKHFFELGLKAQKGE